jgi:hypothetical protein
MVTKPAREPSAAGGSNASASTGSTPANDTPPANALPAAVIAQAESAIYGQFDNEDEDMPRAERSASRATVPVRRKAPKLK